MSKNKDNFEEDLEQKPEQQDAPQTEEKDEEKGEEKDEEKESGGILSFLKDKSKLGYLVFGGLFLLILVLGGRSTLMGLFSGGKEVKAPTAAPLTRQNRSNIEAAKIEAAKTEMSAEMTPNAVKDIVKDFIMSNPDVIITSLTKFQQKAAEQRAQESKDYISKNSDAIIASKPYIGNAKGDIIITEFFDYKCAYCKKIYADLVKLIKDYPNLKIALVELPFFGPSSIKAVKFSLAVNALYPDKFYDFHSNLINADSIDDNTIYAFIAQYGMDKAALLEKVNSDEIDNAIKENMRQATSAGVQGVPSFIIGGEFTTGTPSYDDLKKKIDALIKKPS